MNIYITIALIYLFFLARDLFLFMTAQPKGTRWNAFFSKLGSCSKCLSFWLALLLTLDPIKAAYASMFFGVLSYFFPLIEQK